METTFKIPLAERMRPQHISDYIGQQHLVGPKGILKKHIEQGIISSLILWGPPGVGKTTLAELMAKELKRTYYKLSAVDSSVKDIREIIEKTKTKDLFNPLTQPILFIDEIHRFNKSQQDALLAAVESGTIILIGATTENPSFEVIPALLSRCQVYVLKNLENDQLMQVLERAMTHDSFLAQKKIVLKETEALFRLSNGDARKLLNIFDLVIQSSNEEVIEVTNENVQEVAQQKTVLYDKNGEMHYDIISAFIKSIRGSDPNAAVYWLARMIAGGEDVKFIARRLLISASEDIGIANPTALVIANNCFQAVQVIGYPESEIILSQTTIYLATSVKSNASYMAIKKAKSEVYDSGNLAVPLALRNAPTKLMKNLNYGKDYQYSHEGENNFIEQEFLPKEISGTSFYQPGNNAKELELKKYLNKLWKGKYGY